MAQYGATLPVVIAHALPGRAGTVGVACSAVTGRDQILMRPLMLLNMVSIAVCRGVPICVAGVPVGLF